MLKLNIFGLFGIICMQFPRGTIEVGASSRKPYSLENVSKVLNTFSNGKDCTELLVNIILQYI